MVEMKYKIREIEQRDNKEVENVIRACLIEYDCRTIDLINYDVILLI